MTRTAREELGLVVSDAFDPYCTAPGPYGAESGSL